MYEPNKVGVFSLVDYDSNPVFWPTEWNANLGSGTVSNIDAMMPHFAKATTRLNYDHILWSPLGTTTVQVPAARAFTLACAINGEALNKKPVIYSSVVSAMACLPANSTQRLHVSAGFGVLDDGAIDIARTNTSNNCKGWSVEHPGVNNGDAVSTFFRDSTLFVDTGDDGWNDYPFFAYARFENGSSDPIFLEGLKAFISIHKFNEGVANFDPNR